MSADEATDVCDVVVARPNGECLYKLHYTADGVIVCTVVGFWSIENAEAFLLDYGRFIRQVRHPARPLRILVDLTTSSVMTQALADRFAAAHRELFRTRRHLKVCSPDNDFSDISGTWATLHASTAPLAR
ncbi:MAG TPA: hypothetical protein VF503_16985 [Sphingobium sp.]|uniref:hypothetical protein n=1 Tax=Sphingobium sp. TaxID=1912891 RepID=UPI002ED1B1FF